MAERFRFSPETKKALGENVSFFEAVARVCESTRLALKGSDSEAVTEVETGSGSDRTVTFVYPLDDNEIASDGRIYLKDRFVFDAGERRLLEYRRSFELHPDVKDLPEWQERLKKFQEAQAPALLDPGLKKFAFGVALTHSRPLTKEFKDLLKTQLAYLSEAARAARYANADLVLRVGDAQANVTRRERDGELIFSLNIPVDADSDPAAGRLFLHERFTLDASTRRVKAVSRTWSVAPETSDAERASLAAHVQSLNGLPGPTLAAGETFVKALLPALPMPLDSEPVPESERFTGFGSAFRKRAKARAADSAAASGGSETKLLNALRPLLGRRDFQQVTDALAEPNRELRASGLARIARENLLKNGKAEAAQELAVALAREPGGAKAAAEILDYLQGRGSVGVKTEFLLPAFVEQTTKPSMLLAMAGSGMVGPLAELGGLRLFRHFGAVGPVGRFGANLIGIAGEAATFTTLHKLGDSVSGPRDGLWDNWSGETGSAMLLFGAMRLAHRGSGFFAQRMGEGRMGSVFGGGTSGRLGEGPAHWASPTGRIYLGRDWNGAGPSLPALKPWGQAASAAVNHGSAIGTMALSGYAAQHFDLTPGGGHGFGSALFDATVMYTQAMAGFRLANGLSAGRLQSALGEVRLRSHYEAQEAAKGTTANGGRVIWPLWEQAFEPVQKKWDMIFADRVLAAKPETSPDGVAAAKADAVSPRAYSPVPPAPPAEPAVPPPAGESSATVLVPFAGVDAAFHAAGWTEAQKVEILAVMEKNFKEDRLAIRVLLNLESKRGLEQIMPPLLLALTETGFSVDAQAQFLKKSSEMDGYLPEFLDHLPRMLHALKSNGLSLPQINEVLDKFRDSLIERQRAYEHAAANGHCFIMSPLGSESSYNKILAALQTLQGTEWTVSRKVAWLLKTGMSEHYLEIFRLNYPIVHEWVRREGWTRDNEADFLTALTFQFTHFDYPGVRKVLAAHRFTSDQQAQVLSSLAGAQSSLHQFAYNLEKLDAFLSFLEGRHWSVRDSFLILNHLSGKCGGTTFDQLPSLREMIRSLEQAGWPVEEIKEFLFGLTEKSGVSPNLFLKLSHTFRCLTGLGWDRGAQRRYLLRVFAAAETDLEEALGVFHVLSSAGSPATANAIAVQFLKLLESCNAYNRKPVLLLFAKHGSLFQRLGPEHFPDHFSLYAAIMERWPRTGYSIIHNLLQATGAGILPARLDTHKAWIAAFIERTGGFNAVHYRLFLTEGQSFLDRIDRLAQGMLKDQLSLEEARKMIRDYDGGPDSGSGTLTGRVRYYEEDYLPANPTEGEKFLLGMMQRISPTSGVSFANDDAAVGLLRRVLAAGDLRGHVPDAWRDRVAEFEIGRGAMELKPGEVLDPEGRVKALLDEFRSSRSEPGHEELTEAMIAYLASGRQPAEKKRLQQILFARAAASEELRERLDGIHGLDFTSISVLEEIFKDPDHLPKFLAEAFAEVPRGQGLVTQLGPIVDLEGDGSGVVKQIKKLAQNQNITPERRKEILTNLLKAYKSEGIQVKILLRPDISEDIKEEIRAVMGEKPDLTPKEIIEEILEEPRLLIQNEKAKYRYENQGMQKIGVRAVKGVAFALHGFLSGVCTASDIELWKDPNFKLLAITDEAGAQALGYIHVYETTIDGKKYLTLPGINPSAEFLGAFNRKMTAELLKKLMGAVQGFAEAGGYEGVYIPRSTNIHSNRSYIHEAVAKAKYPTKTIPSVNWNHLPTTYPFSQVFVVWER